MSIIRLTPWRSAASSMLRVLPTRQALSDPSCEKPSSTGAAVGAAAVWAFSSGAQAHSSAEQSSSISKAFRYFM